MNHRALPTVWRFAKVLAITGLLLTGFLLSGTPAHAVSITATTTTANVAKANTQTATTSTTTAAVQEVLASVTVGVLGVPSDSETVVIGDCVVTFSGIGGDTVDELDCGNDAAVIDISLGGGDVPRNESEIAEALTTLLFISDSDHGMLDISAPTASTTRFTASASTTATSTIDFTDGTGGDIATTSQVYGVIGVTQVRTLTIGGTIETGDVFYAVLPTVGDVSYTASSTDSTASHVANGLLDAIHDSAGYAGQAFTAATSTNTIIFTGKATGTVFMVNSRTANATSTAQVAVITPASVASGYIFTVTVNSTDYDYTSTNSTLQTVVEGIDAALDDATELSCTEDDTEITCTAVTPGTSFAIDASVEEAPSSGGGGGGGGGGNRTKKSDTVPTTPTPAGQADTIVKLRAQILALIPVAQAMGITLPPALIAFANTAAPATPAGPVRDLTLNSEGSDVTALQNILVSLSLGQAAKNLAAVGTSGFFGPLTQAALAEYQTQKGIAPATGYFGALTRAHMKAAGVAGIWW